jgi:hypothetical protein
MERMEGNKAVHGILSGKALAKKTTWGINGGFIT